MKGLKDTAIRAGARCQIAVCEQLGMIAKKSADDRGDVPGWVLVTVMTAGLVVAIWSVADGQLKSVLSGALHSVSQP
ncbi:MAG: hypothetical protein WCO64_05995 [Actinomycetes bacterium]